MPLISVCLATYNGERFLAEQVQSILDQTFADFELVVSDDNSTDRTPAILADFAARDGRVRILPSHDRLGFQKNFEFAIASGVGSYIAPSDQDDIWLPEKLERLLAHLRSNNLAAAYCDSEFIDDDGCSLNMTMLEQRWPIEGHDAMMFAFHNSAAAHATLFDRAILAHALPFPKEPFFDWWLAAVATAVGGISALRMPLVKYRQHDFSVTAGLRAGLEKRGRRFVAFDDDSEEIRRLESFGRLPGEAGAAYRELHSLWKRRATDRFIPQLALFLLRHRSVFAFRNTSMLRTTWRCLKQAFGMPARHPFRFRNSRGHA